MRYSEHYNLWLPEDTDPVLISKLTENFETLDELFSEQGAKVAWGSYVGNGKAGSTEKNTLVFPFVPMVLIVCGETSTTKFYAVRGQKKVYTISDDLTTEKRVTISIGETTTWYGEAAVYQLNTNGSTYYYFAAG